MDKVIADHTPVCITRHEAQACVLVSLDDWEAMEETNYLRGSPVNAQRLTDAIAELESGGPEVVKREAAEFLRA